MTSAKYSLMPLPQVETRVDRLNAMYGTVLRCVGALSGNADPTSHLVCEALQQVADELAEMIAHDADTANNTARRSYWDTQEHWVDY